MRSRNFTSQYPIERVKLSFYTAGDVIELESQYPIERVKLYEDKNITHVINPSQYPIERVKQKSCFVQGMAQVVAIPYRAGQTSSKRPT